MGSTKKCNKDHDHSSRIRPKDTVSGYIVTQVSRLESFDAELIQLTHQATGSRHIHIARPDKENTFSVMFRTVPEDSTGVAHILEHTVLCGSSRYNVRDPFFSMLKRSLSTFMNAFTSSDWTMYPFSTQNRKDYFNLMDVYLDAVFFPNLDETSFKQEGHRIELASDTELTYKGVVYNEMKGAMSSPAQVLGRSLLTALYPDTTYRNNSGGEPADIPKLTHSGLKSFHARYYHPSNAFFYTYGCFDLTDTLAFIDKKVLNRFQALNVDSAVPPQPRWHRPRTAGAAYLFSKTEDPKKKYQACVAWLTCDATDHFEVLVLTVLEQILLGNAASPLRKALIDSNLGSALSDAVGFDPDNRDTMFAAGLKDIYEADAGTVESLVMSTLRQIADTGIDRHFIDSAIHQIEFHRKEITNTPHPFGIKLILSVSSPLIHEADPVAFLNIDRDLETLKDKIESGPFLENKIREYFIDNPHRVLFTLSPDQDLEERENRRVKQELAAVFKTLSRADLDRIRKEAKQLADLQEKEEDVSVLPTLEIEDIPPEIEIIPPSDLPELILTTGYEKQTSDILYFTCPAGMTTVPDELIPLVPFFCKAFTNAGTRETDYARIAQKVDLYTGGVMASPFSGLFYPDSSRVRGFVSIQGKALEKNTDFLFELFDELISRFSFHDLERLKQLLFMYRASLESSLVASGHMYALSLASRHLTPASHVNELWHGITQYQTVKSLTQQVESTDSALNGLSDDLSRIAGAVCRRNNIRPAAVGSLTAIRSADRHISRINGNLSGNGNSDFSIPAAPMQAEPPLDGWHTNTTVSFVARSFKTVRFTHEDAPALAIISKLLRSLYLHREIREKGGAYGGFASYNYDEGIFSFASYRDPHITRTLDVFDRACDFITKGEYRQTDIKEAILQVCSDIDRPETPGPASIKAFYRTITGLTDEMRLEFKHQLLGLTKDRIIRTARTYFSPDNAQQGTAVISGREQLETANRELEKPLALLAI